MRHFEVRFFFYFLYFSFNDLFTNIGGVIKKITFLIHRLYVHYERERFPKHYSYTFTEALIA